MEECQALVPQTPMFSSYQLAKVIKLDLRTCTCSNSFKANEETKTDDEEVAFLLH